MQTMSITEALAEIKLIDKKVQKKRENVAIHATRFEHIADPYVEEGGSSEYIKKETQAICDLLTTRIRIREAISRANLDNTITCEGATQSICSWLVWKREVYNVAFASWTLLKAQVERKLAENANRPQLFKKDDTAEPSLAKMVSHVDIPALQREQERQQTIFERLDGLLSMKNAQIQISF